MSLEKLETGVFTKSGFGSFVKLLSALISNTAHGNTENNLRHDGICSFEWKNKSDFH